MKSFVLALLLIPIDAAGKCLHPRPASCATYDAVFQKHARAHRLPWQLLRALAWRESKCDPCAISHAGAQGMMQIIPETFDRLRPFARVDDPFDPNHSVAAGAYYLAALLAWFDGDVRSALAGYNTGPGRVDAGRIPSATEAYVDDILHRFHQLGGTFR